MLIKRHSGVSPEQLDVVESRLNSDLRLRHYKELVAVGATDGINYSEKRGVRLGLRLLFRLHLNDLSLLLSYDQQVRRVGAAFPIERNLIRKGCPA